MMNIMTTMVMEGSTTKNNTFVLQGKKHLLENVENAIFQMIKPAQKQRYLYKISSDAYKTLSRAEESTEQRTRRLKNDVIEWF